MWSDDNTSPVWSNWGNQQPDNIRVNEYSSTGQHYVAVHKLFRYWDDSEGDRLLPALCQVSVLGEQTPETFDIHKLESKIIFTLMFLDTIWTYNSFEYI